MNIKFEISPTNTTEFGVGLRVGEAVRYLLFPVDSTVQEALRGEAQVYVERRCAKGNRSSTI